MAVHSELWKKGGCAMRRTTYDQGGWKCGAGAVDAVVSDITYVAATGEFGLVIRRKSLLEKE